MPKIDGVVHRSRFTKLHLKELSSVDRPAQVGATMAILKRDDDNAARVGDLVMVAKYIGCDDGAHTFAEVIAENQFSEKIWPFTDALSQSIRSIVGDRSLTGEARDAKIQNSVADFLSAVRNLSPDVAKQLSGLVNKKELEMPKTVEQLETEVSTLKGEVSTLTARAEKAEADFKAMSDAKDKAETDCAEAKKALTAATDETLKVDDTTEVKKSEVGDAQFKVMKAFADKATLATMEKRADAEFGHVTGTATEKAALLAHIDSLDAENPARKAMEAVLTSAEKMAKGAFTRIGGGSTEVPLNVQKAADDFDAKVTEIAKRDDIPRTEAMRKARSEHPDLFAAMTEGNAPASAAN